MIFLGIATYVTHFEETTFSMKYAKNISETTEVLGMTTKDSKVKLEKVNRNKMQKNRFLFDELMSFASFRTKKCQTGIYF